MALRHNHPCLSSLFLWSYRQPRVQMRLPFRACMASVCGGLEWGLCDLWRREKKRGGKKVELLASESLLLALRQPSEDQILSLELCYHVFGFSRYIAFIMYLDIVYTQVHNKSYIYYN